MLADQFVLTSRRIRARHVAVAVVALLVAALLNVVLGEQKARAAGSSCGVNINPVACENSQTSGVTDEDTWDVDDAGDNDIQGFSTDMSVNAGNTINFKVKTSATRYTIDIYRLGYYGGAGARRQAPTINVNGPSNASTACVTDPSVSLVDCGNWSVSSSWAVPSSAVSGVYIAHLTRTDNADESLITFIVRNDASTSDIIYQTSDETWQAYNRYGQFDFYTGALDNQWDSPSRARKLSYNRPFATRNDDSGRDFLFSNEYPTIRFLERNGYDVSYMAGVDADRYGSLLKNHKVYMSVGHDEYWSGNQRANVESARDAGVNLMFLSGNEVYWHTRFENSIDGSNTAYRTLVCYKETWDNSPTDPTGTSTATWRDPRFGAAPGGSNPENALTGTMYMANSDDLPITVTKTQGKTRLWRGTNLSTMSGASTALAPHTVGYESDEDLDNGFRPAGLIELSTTVGDTPQELQDFGSVVAPGTTTHHLTLYRASSGALVFGAGTIQWGWGLDADHDGNGDDVPADSRMQQATANMLADMHALPSTLMSGLVAATPSTDTQAPTSTITSPASGAAIANGTKVTVTGTAVDNGGGQVAGVEVSIDGGTTWHPASGTTSWTYTGVIHGNGPVAVKSRATDDSANVEMPPAGVTVTTKCPCALFGNATPASPDSGDGSSVELGVRFSSPTGGAVIGVRFYKANTNTGTHTGTLWTADGTQLATGTFTGETSSGWQTLQFATPVNISANTTYVASYYAPNGHYSADSLFFYYKPYSAPPLQAEINSPTTDSTYNGVYAGGHSFPDQSYQGTNYYVDPVFIDSTVSLPSVTAHTPASGAAGVAVTVAPTATFSKAVTPSSIVFTLRDVSGTAVAGTTGYASGSNTATFTPGAALRTGATYTASVTATDATGLAMTSPDTWTFTTAGTPTCPCTLFGNSTPADVDSGDASAVSLGVQFTSSLDGFISGVRFYKAAGNTGTHTGSLWSATGTRLATGTFTGESTTGWQTLQFASPIAVTAGTTYVASYYTPNGHYSDNNNFFATTYTNNPLSAPGGSNGVYLYGSDGFPTLTYNSTNYWADPIFTTTAPGDTTPPTVVSTNPNAGSASVPTSVAPSATFSEAVSASSIAFTLKNASGTSVSGTVAYSAANKTATFTPTSALAAGVTYTASVSASDVSGNAMTSPTTWTFTTSSPTSCPCTLFPSGASPTNVDSDDASALTLGVQFVPTVDGSVTGIRFYKAATNTGSHTGSLWSSSGAELATATFTGESSSGWQTVTFSQPVAVTAGVTYVAGYYAPNGHYSYDAGFFSSAYSNPPLTAPAGSNGVYAYGGASTFPSSSYNSTNYWVDPVFTSGSAPPGDTTPPNVTGVTATGTSSTSATVAWTTDEAATSRVDYGTSATSLNLNATIPGLATSHSVPLTGLAPNARYYYRVTSADAAGNSTMSPASPGPPASYAPSTTPLTDATSADFGAGTTSSTYVAGNADGEVVLTPTVGQEFSGTTLPSGWTSSAVVTGGTSTVASGSVTVSGANLSSTTTYTNGKFLEMMATLNKSQSIGWVGSSNANVKISFTVNASNQLIATVNDGLLNNATSVAMTGWTAAPHKFRFEWTSSAANFYVDDVQKYTHAFSSVFSGNLKPLLNDSVRTDANLAVDWLRVGQYAASGTFTSRVFDGQGTVTWDGLSWDATVPAGSTLTVKVRAGNTATPDASWTAFATISASGGSIGQTKRYVQYQLTLTSTGSRFTTAQVRSVTAAFHL